MTEGSETGDVSDGDGRTGDRAPDDDRTGDGTPDDGRTTDRRNLSRRRLLAAAAATTSALAGCNALGTPTEEDEEEDDEPQPVDTPTEKPTKTWPSETPTVSPTSTPPASRTLRVGVLQPTTGALKYYGKQSLWGFYTGLAVRAGREPLTADAAAAGDYGYEVGDVTYELHVRDTKLNRSRAASLASELVRERDVDLLVGCTAVNTAVGVLEQVVEPSGTPMLVGPASGSALTADPEFCHDRVFRASESTAMTARGGARYIVDHTDVTSVVLFGADYSYGHEIVENYSRVLERAGVDVITSKFVPVGFREWTPLLDDAEQAGADAVVSGLSVRTGPFLYTSFLQGDYDFRVFGDWKTRIGIDALGGVLQKALDGPLTREKIRAAGIGPLATPYHWTQYDNEINRRFVETYTDAYRIVPDRFTSGAFTAASALDQAVRAAGSTDGGDVAAAMRGMTVDQTPKGRGAYRFQRYNNQARSPVTVAPAVPTSDAWRGVWPADVMPDDPVATVPGEQVTVPKDSDRMGCSLP